MPMFVVNVGNVNPDNQKHEIHRSDSKCIHIVDHKFSLRVSGKPTESELFGVANVHSKCKARCLQERLKMCQFSICENCLEVVGGKVCSRRQSQN